ncbi:MAG: type IV secretory system conjugative DNA transfer family protein [Rickettsiales bacterium]|nr:type IV secretory system conjugative DNA transfer family protein [Rickettsiales bacterium]
MKFYKFQNAVIIALVIGLILSVFLYVAFIASFAWFYGAEYLDPQYTLNPPYILERYLILLDYFIVNYDILPPEYQYGIKLFVPAGAAFAATGMVLFILRAPLFDFRPFQPKEKLHGDARWATEKDIRQAGLRSKEGLLVGQTGKGYLIAPGFQHVLLFAPTGSGKGVGFVIPNLLFWKESVIIHDIKLENYELTSGYRKNEMDQKVFLWNPASPDGISHCYNPLDWVSTSMGQQVDDVQKIANLLLPEQEFWQNEARSLFVGVVLYLIAVPEKITSLGEVVRTLRSDDVVYNLAVVLDTLGRDIHPVAYMNIAAFLQKADKERSGVISTLNSSLELWANPLIDATTAKSDFDFNQFKKEATTVYVGLTPDNIDRLKPLMQIFYQQASQIMTKHMPRPDEKIGVLFMMDEFPTLGEMIQFKQGIAYFRGYKVRLFLIIQDTEQLKDIYEEAGMNSFLANSTYRITFAANNTQTAQLISELIGNKTVKQVSRNSPVFLDLNPATRSKHISEAQRALLLPQEVIGLPRDEQIILIESSPPIKTKKIFYYKDPYFTKRLLPQIDIPQQEPFDPRKAKEELKEELKNEEEENADNASKSSKEKQTA